MTLQQGCQTYTWEMLGPAWRGGPDDLLTAIADAGYSGIEITDTMIGRYADQPGVFAKTLAARGLELVAFACGSASGFTEPTAIAADLVAVDRALRFTGAFPGAFLSLGSATIVSPGNLDSKFETAAAFYNEVGRRGLRAGVPVALHPSSHHGTLLGTRAEYDRIMAMTDPALIGWVPDTGHILRGRQDLLDTLRAYADRVRYIHLKDVDADGVWRMLGDGICDTRAVVAALQPMPHFSGWLVLEEESAEAAADPAGAVRRNRQTLGALLGVPARPTGP
jgi:inosose dehydratase